MKILIVFGTAAISIATWREFIPIGLTLILAEFLDFAYNYLFIPISVISMPLAFLIFVSVGFIGVALRFAIKKIIRNESVYL